MNTGIKVITADHAVAIAAKLARVDFIAAYPITPQTLIVEHLAEFINDGELDAKYLHMESEHSVMSACIGAQAAGVRTFTATASQGLAFMHEMVYVPGPLRLPIVMVNVNRTLGGPPSIWVEHNDSMAERDSGWIQVYVEDNQEAFDMVLQAYRIAENKKVLLPVMVCLDGFVLSHTVEPVVVPAQEDVDKFLPAYDPDIRLDTDNPMIIGSLMTPDYIMEMRHQTCDAMDAARGVIREVDREFNDRFGRKYGGLIETYRIDDAETALITMGTITSTAREVVDELREQGQKIGLIKLRFFRPFPRDEIIEAAEKLGALGVVDRSISYGEGGGPVFTEVKAAIYGLKKHLPDEYVEAIESRCGLCIPVIDHIAGLGGRDVTREQIKKMFEITMSAARGGVVNTINWHNTRGVKL